MRSTLLYVVAFGGLAVADGGRARAAERCLDYADGKRLGVIDDKRLLEVSGIAASALQPGVLWVHNDSGADTWLYAIDESGERLAKFAVDGADAVDWEDVALGPCTEGGTRDCVFIADTGNNDGDRDDQTIYRVAEPEVDDPGEATEPAEAMGVVLPDGVDVEALFSDEGGELWLVGKDDEVARLYWLGVFQADVTVDADEVAQREDLGRITGADATADGTRIVVRSNERAWELFRSGARGVASAFRGEALEIDLDKEAQGEAIAFDPEGAGFYTTSEGKKAPLRWYRCKRFGATLTGKEDAGGVIADPTEPGDAGCAGARAELALVVGLCAVVFGGRRRAR